MDVRSWKPALLRLKPFGPDSDREVEVESKTSTGRYRVNLHRMTCTCPDFTDRRASRAHDDIGRACKHIREVILSLDTDAFGDELTRVLFKSPFGPYDRIFFAPDPRGDTAALGFVDGKPWVNVFCRRESGEPYTRFGYQPEEDRWAYDDVPPFAGEWAASVRGLSKASKSK